MTSHPEPPPVSRERADAGDERAERLLRTGALAAAPREVWDGAAASLVRVARRDAALRDLLVA
ncbi:hypothetical protein, partial [Actinomadura kijaniata]|uniref:hypothetical protein n=1 Tax=Actinomadura kijaniata TaxID=46161 RepID=UPI0012FB455E